MAFVTSGGSCSSSDLPLNRMKATIDDLESTHAIFDLSTAHVSVKTNWGRAWITFQIAVAAASLLTVKMSCWNL
jgi:hypothetical protein